MSEPLTDTLSASSPLLSLSVVLTRYVHCLFSLTLSLLSSLSSPTLSYSYSPIFSTLSLDSQNVIRSDSADQGDPQGDVRCDDQRGNLVRR
jgi:hypothetical protein